MLSETVQYKDFNGVNKTENVYFNLTKTELIDHMYLHDELLALSEMLNPENSANPEEFTLTQGQVQQILDMVKKLAKLAYGVRSDDGKRFIKGDKVWEEFTQTAIYDAWLFELFTDIEKATAWMVSILPDDLRSIAEEGIATEGQSLNLRAVQDRAVEDVQLPEEATDGWAFMERVEDYSLEYLLNCSENEFQSIVQHFSNGRNIPFQLLVAGGKRMAGGDSEG